MAGSYYEACNCQAICPCRRKNGVSEGRSTYGVCQFALSWRILRGHFRDIPLDGLSVVMVGRYNDDDEGRPWTVGLYVDESADEKQTRSLGGIFSGKAGGNILFTSRIAKVSGVTPARIELDHTENGEWMRVGTRVEAGVVAPVEFDGVITCAIPGHGHPGRESVSNLRVSDGEYQWEHKERCGFATDFEYWLDAP